MKSFETKMGEMNDPPTREMTSRLSQSMCDNTYAHYNKHIYVENLDYTKIRNIRGSVTYQPVRPRDHYYYNCYQMPRYVSI